MKKLKKLLLNEISVEIKTCVYFLCIVSFYCTVQLINGSHYANIFMMLQMIFAVYFIQYIWMLLGNDEETGHIGVRECISQLIICILYVVVSYIGNWFDRNLVVTIIFVVYLILMYLVVTFIFYVKAKNDTKVLNQMLQDFKKRGKSRKHEQ